MAPAKGFDLKKAVRPWSEVPRDLSRETGGRHRSLRPRGKERRSIQPEEVEADDGASGDESEDDNNDDDSDDGHDDHGFDSNRNGAQQLSPSISATTTTPDTEATTTTPDAGVTTTTPGTTALETTSAPVAALPTTHLHATTTVIVPLLTGSPTTTGRSTPNLPLGAIQTHPASFTSTVLSAQPTDDGIELNVGSNTADGSSNIAAKEPPHTRDPTVERALIAVGSIGAFVTICFLYFAWRAWRKCKREKAASLSITDTDARRPPGDGERPLPRAWHGLQKRVTGGNPFASRHRDRPWESLEEKGKRSSTSTGTHSVWLAGTPAPPQMQDNDHGVEATGRAPRDVLGIPYALPQVIVSTEKTDDLTQQREARESVLSSLSSGFGDDVTVIKGPRPGRAAFPPPPLPPLPPMPVTVMPPTPASDPSWMRSSYQRRTSGTTAYTEATEDGRHRFRSVASWVRQQAGRLQHVQAGAGDGDCVSGGKGAAGEDRPPRLDAAAVV